MSVNFKSIFQTVLLLSMLLVVGNLHAQTKGTVTDATGEPVIGATVMEKGNPKNATVTDFDGNFTLKVSGDKPIVISYVGMKTKEINVKGKAQVNVKMEDDNTTLNDIVVIGYTTVRKKDLTGAVSQVSAKQIEDVPVSNVTEALTGKMAGVNITTTEGSPDADIKIRVRGGGSLSQDNSPLYIVDGFEVSSINDIAPSEIETIDVLKDAASTAIYGARGANGVVIVTTKSGKEGNVKITMNGSMGWKKMTKEVKILSPYEYGYYQYELSSGTKFGTTNSYYGAFNDLDMLNGIEGTNYQKEIFGRTGIQHNYDINVSGGNKDITYSLSYAHNDQKAIMLGSDYKRDNISGKLKAKLNKWLDLDFKVALANEKVNGLGSGADTNESTANNSLVAQATRYTPIEQISTDEDEVENTSTRVDPLTRILQTSKEKRIFTQTYNAGLTWKPFKGWRFNSKIQYQWKNTDTDQVWLGDASRNSKYGDQGYPQAAMTYDDKKSISNTNTVQYDNKKIFGGRHKLTAILGQEWKETMETERENISTRFDSSWTVDGILSNMSAAGNTKPNYSYVHPNDRLVSFFGQVLYTIDEKYLFNVTLRTDGSSKFGKGNRWGWFPAGQFAWRMSEEKFLKNVDWLSNLKMRISFGTAGNNRIPSDAIATQLKMASNTATVAYFNGQAAPSYGTPSALYNPDLKWETTITRNFGFDFGLLRGRINGSLDLYWNTTKDLLMKARVQSSSGYSYQYQNFGKTSNKGIELSTNIVAIDKKNFTLNANFNIAYNRNNIDELNTEDKYQSSNFAGSSFSQYEDFKIEEGGRLGEVWGYELNGLYRVATWDDSGNFTGQAGDLILDGTAWKQVDANGNILATVADDSYMLTGGTLYPGGPKFKDQNGDGKIDKEDKVKLGNTIPTVTGGFGVDGQARFKFGTFDYAVFCNFSLGNKIVNGTKAALASYTDTQAHWNLNNDFILSNRASWIDPATGLNLGCPHDQTIDLYGANGKNLMNTLAALTNEKAMYNPAAATRMVITDYALENASFLRLQSLTIGYSLPKKLIKKAYMENLRFYVTAHNLFCWTNYSGYDPEVDTSSKKNPMCPGIDYAAYPKARSYVMGVNVTF